MRQTKPFIVEIKQSRKLKPNAPKPSIWGKLDLSTTEDQVDPAAIDRAGHRDRRPAVNLRSTQAASRTSIASGCSPWRNAVARWACAAAWKIARLSSASTFSQDWR